MNLSEAISELFKGIVPNVYLMAATLISFLLLMTVVTIFVYKPIKKYLAAKKAFIQKNIDETIENNKKAALLEQQRSLELQEAQQIKQEINIKIQQEANEIIEKSRTLANLESKKILEDGKRAAQAFQEKVVLDNKKLVLEAAFNLATKFLQKQDAENKDNQEKLISELEKELG
ncbi:ATP synthase subunit B [Mesomycoplasma conjunctivae]|nr:ATP synthase F0 subunit B [Mesomycoplasma conjunctivae]VEU66570.1 ATP synthase subunit B [Mesomycoplasma conjunctivae]